MAISDEDSCGAVLLTFFEDVFGTMVAEAKLSLGQLWSLSLSMLGEEKMLSLYFWGIKVEGDSGNHFRTREELEPIR